MTKTESTLRLYSPRQIPLAWVVEDLATGEFWIVRVHPDGWKNKTPYRGWKESLDPVWGYCYFGSGIPLAREWKTVCEDKNGLN